MKELFKLGRLRLFWSVDRKIPKQWSTTENDTLCTLAKVRPILEPGMTQHLDMRPIEDKMAGWREGIIKGLRVEVTSNNTSATIKMEASNVIDVKPGAGCKYCREPLLTDEKEYCEPCLAGFDLYQRRQLIGGERT